MRQLVQDTQSGAIEVVDAPAPGRPDSHLLVASVASVISAGTERALTDLGRKTLAGKAHARPDLARKVIDAARDEGLRTTFDKVRGRLGEPTVLGYSSCGVVLESPTDFPAGPGDLVACGGAGRAAHAEVVAVPRNLCARVPDDVPAEDAAYATLAAIALHGFRLTGARLGEVIAVIGLGLVGQLTMDIIAAAGCVPLGVDPDADRVRLSREAGHLAVVDSAALTAEALRLTHGRGTDAVVVTAASREAGPLQAAIEVARERAIVSIVGDVPVDSPRAPLFAKELQLVVSRSYGPGRYDPAYEERGHDYPVAYVRWTEGRNLEEVLRLMAMGAIRPARLTTHSFELAQGALAYELLESDEPSLGILLRYPTGPAALTRQVDVQARRSRALRPLGSTRPRVGVIGAGTFARTVLLPALKGHVEYAAVVTATGASARATAQRFGAPIAGTDPAAVLEDPAIDAVVIATRHDTHAGYAISALQAGKHVFVEKPLALNEGQLAQVELAARGASAGTLTVGLNRRFAPLAVQLRDALSKSGSVLASLRVNAGRIPRSHWTHDPAEGGGRIVGEVCHFVDLAAFLCGAAPIAVTAQAVSGTSEPREDTLAATLRFPSGSLATINYSALGDSSLPKERIEVLGELGAGVLDDFRTLTLHLGGRRTTAHGRRNKGHGAQMKAFARACQTGVPAQDLDELVGVMHATYAIREAIQGARATAS